MDYKNWNRLDNAVILPKRLKVGDMVVVKCINVPDTMKLCIKLSYNNRFLEDGNLFKAWTKYEDPKKTIEQPSDNVLSSPLQLSEKEEEIKDVKTKIELAKPSENNFDQDSALSTMDEKIKNDTIRPEKSTTDFEFWDNYYFKKLNVVYKVNLTNLNSSLGIYDAKNYIYSQVRNNGQDVMAAKAKKDINWQQNIIKYYTSNQTTLEKHSKDYIELLKHQRDSLSKINESNTHCEYIHFRVENYDNTSCLIQIKDVKKDIVKKTAYQFKNKGSFKIDFSTGLAFNRLIDDKYEIVKEDKPIVKDSTNTVITNDTIRVIRSSKNLFNAGPTVLAHGYFRTGRQVAYGFTAGLSYNFQNENLNYVLGGSLLLGQEQRLILTAGMFLGKRKVLPKYYKIDTDYDRIRFENQYSTTINYHEVWDCAFGIAVSYNLNLSNLGSKDLDMD